MLKRILCLLPLALFTACPAGSGNRLTVTPNQLRVSPGESNALTASFEEGGAKTDVTPSATWSSENPSIATVSRLGVVTGVSDGAATIVVTYRGATAAARVTVNSPGVVLDSIDIEPKNPALRPGAEQQLKATGIYADGSSKDLTLNVTWSSAKSDVATVSAVGVLKAVGAGTSAITAVLDGLSANTTVAVTGTAADSLALQCGQERCPPTLNLSQDGVQRLVLQASYADGSNADVTELASWTSSNPSVVAVSDEAENKGMLTASSAGNADITATFDGKTVTLPVTVTAVALVSVNLPTAPMVAKGQAVTLQATGKYSDDQTRAVNESLEWTSSNLAVATISNDPGSKGRLTALSQGTTTVTASRGTVTASVTVTVGAPAVTSITLSQTTGKLTVAGTLTLKATGALSDSTEQDVSAQVTWTSSKPTIASVSSAGVVTGVANGEAVITAAIGTIKATATVTVSAASLTSIALTPANPQVAKGRTLLLTATGTFSDGSIKQVTSQTTWTSSDLSKVTVAAGRATAVDVGSATVTATLEGKTASVVVTVGPAALSALALTQDSTKLTTGTTRTLVLTGTYSDNTTQTLTTQAVWSSSVAEVASVSAVGVVTAKRMGDTRITAKVGSILATAPVATCGLVINEVQTAGSAGDGDEFVEIRNTCPTALSLAGHKLKYGFAGVSTTTALFDFTTQTLGPQGFFVLGGAAFTGAKDAVLIGGPAGTLVSGGGGVGLFSPSVAIALDSVGYGNATNSFIERISKLAPLLGKSIQRNASSLDTNDNHVDFTEGTPTPGK